MKQFHSFRVFSSLAASAFILFACLIDVQVVVAQGNADIMWSRGHFPDLDLSFFASPQNHTVLCAGYDWECWPVSQNVLPTRALSFADTIYDTIDEPGDSVMITHGLDYATYSVMTKGGNEIISGCGNRIIAWNTALNVFTLIANLPDSVAVSGIDATPDGSLVAVTYEDFMLFLYDRRAGKIIHSWKNDFYGPVSLSSDGNLLLASLGSSPLSLINTKTGAEVRRFSNVFNEPWVLAFNPMRPGTFIEVDGGSNGLQEIDTSGNIIINWPNEFPTEIAFSPSGSKLAVSAGSTDIIDLDSKEVISTLFNATGWSFLNEDTIVGMGANPIGFNPGISLYSVSTGQWLFMLSTGAEWSGPNTYTPNGSIIVTESGAYSSDSGVFLTPWIAGDVIAASNRAFAGVGENGAVTFWSSIADTGTQVSPGFISDSVNIGAVAAISPNDSILATGLQISWAGYPTKDSRNAIQLWNGPEHKSVMQLDNDLWPVSAIAFSHDGSILAASDSYNGYAWDERTGHRIMTIDGYDMPAQLICFMPGDSSLLVQGDTAFYIFSLSGSLDKVIPATISSAMIVRLPDGSYTGIFSIGIFNYYWHDSTVELFDIASGKVLASAIVRDSGNINTMSVNPITGDFAMGGTDLIVCRSLDAGLSGVNQAPPQTEQPLAAFASNSHIKIDLPIGSESGRVFVYRTDGRCFFSSGVEAGESSVTTSELPSGVYFIVYEPSSGVRAFTKVSLFE